MANEVLLINQSLIIESNLEFYYFNNGVSKDIPVKPLYYSGKKFNMKEAKNYLDGFLQDLKEEGYERLFICDSNYFKLLTKVAKTEHAYGKEFPCKYGNYDFTCILGLNYKALSYDPSLIDKLKVSINTLNQANKQELVINGTYPSSNDDVDNMLHILLSAEYLTCDIETTGLHWFSDQLYSISFSTDTHSGVAFLYSDEIKHILREFFDKYEGGLIFHNAQFDIKFLVFNLYMSNINDYTGLLTGIDRLTRKLDDTKLIAFCAINNTGRPSYGLKDLSFEFAGDYALDEIKDVTKAPVEKLLKYNVTDTCATWYVYNKYWPIVIQDNQENVYRNILMPAVKVLIQTEMTGVPINQDKVKELKELLVKDQENALNILRNNPDVQAAEKLLAQQELDKVNAKLKKTQKTLEDIDFHFNFGSNPQKAFLLFEHLGIEPVDFTDSGEPAVGKTTLAKLKNQGKYLEILDALIALQECEKILSSFVPEMENATNGRLYGNFNLGGTVSGRLSSSNP